MLSHLISKFQQLISFIIRLIFAASFTDVPAYNTKVKDMKAQHTKQIQKDETTEHGTRAKNFSMYQTLKVQDLKKVDDRTIPLYEQNI